MGRRSLCCQGTALAHAEAVLLVRDCQGQAREIDAFAEERMGTHRKVRLAQSQPFHGFPLRLRRHAAFELHHPDTHRFQKLRKGAEMLIRQQLRGGHESRLESGAADGPDAGGGYHRLAGTHIPLHQPVHGAAGGHIPQGIPNGPGLRPRQGEGQPSGERFQLRHGDHMARFAAPLAFHAAQGTGQHEQFFKHQPLPGFHGFGHIVGHMDAAVGAADVRQVIALDGLRRQQIPQLLQAGVQPLTDGFDDGILTVI